MRNASGHQCKVKMSGSEKKKMNEHTYDISFIKRVIKKFLEVSSCSRACLRRLALHDFIFCLIKL